VISRKGHWQLAHCPCINRALLLGTTQRREHNTRRVLCMAHLPEREKAASKQEMAPYPTENPDNKLDRKIMFLRLLRP